MAQLRSIGKENVSDRELFVMSVSDIASLPERFSLPSPHFVALVALDASVVEDDAIRRLAKNLLCSGCAFFTAWGPDCERVHDLFDSVANFYEPLVMTTWEHEEPLDEAIWNFLYVTHPDDGYWDTCRSSVAITVGNADWSAQIERRLRDMDYQTMRTTRAKTPTPADAERQLKSFIAKFDPALVRLRHQAGPS